MFHNPHALCLARIQILQRELEARDSYIHSLEFQINHLRNLLNRSFVDKSTETDSVKEVNRSTETDATFLNSTLIQCKTHRKERKDLNKSQIYCRNLENKRVFTQLANFIEGGEQSDSVKRVWVKIEYGNGSDYSFYAKETVDNENNSLKRKIPLAVLHKVLEVKLRFRISYLALLELRLIGLPGIPPKGELQNEFSRLAGCVTIFDPPRPGLDGASRHLSDILEIVLQHPRYSSVLESGEITLRFACDGAKISKQKESVRATVKIIHSARDTIKEESCKSSPDDELTVLFYMGKEDRSSIEFWMTSLMHELKLSAEEGIYVLGHHLTVKWLLCCDWKAMSILRGINPANSHYFCLWCECTKDQIMDFSIPSWPISRTPERQRECIHARGIDGRRGYSKPDLISWIPFSQMIPDELHLRMRIIGKMLNQVVKWAIELHCTRELMEEMKRIQVSFQLYEEIRDDSDSTNRVHKWSHKGGDDLHKILMELNLISVFGHGICLSSGIKKMTVPQLKDELKQRGLPISGGKQQLLARLKDALEPGERVVPRSRHVTYEFSSDEEEDGDTVTSSGRPAEDAVDVDNLQIIWRRFARLVQAIKALPETEHYLQPDDFKKVAQQWASDFRKVTPTKIIIPYIHCLVYHVPQFLAKYKYLPDIGISQLERKNYEHQLSYFGATSRQGGRFAKRVSQQLLERENVMLYLNQTYPKNTETGMKRRRVEPLDI